MSTIQDALNSKINALAAYFSDDLLGSKRALESQLAVIVDARGTLSESEVEEDVKLEFDAMLANMRLMRVLNRIGDLNSADIARSEALRLMGCRGGTGAILAQAMEKKPQMLSAWLDEVDAKEREGTLITDN